MRIEPWWVSIRGFGSRIAPLVCLTYLALRVAPAAAQAPALEAATGVLVVRVRKVDSTPLPGAFVRSGRIAAIADSAGLARIELPATLRTVVVSAPGLAPRSFEMTIVPDVPNRVEITLAPPRAEGEDLPTSALRRDVRRRDQAVPIEILSGDRILDASLDRPADLVGVLERAEGVVPQAVNGPLGAYRARLGGLPGDLTAVLIDGMPALGGYAGSFGLVQQAPLGYERVEIVRGAASNWFGPTAGVGAIDLISRRPLRTAALLQGHQSSEKGGDILLWGSFRSKPTVAGTVTASFHQQRLVDSDEDAWAEFPRAIRASIQPRLFIDRPNGDGLIGTIGGFAEQRAGGYLTGAGAGPAVYREERRTNGANGSIIGWRGTEATGRLQLKAGIGGQRVEHRFAAHQLHDRRTTVFAEASYQRVVGKLGVVGGLSYQSDALYNRDTTGFDFSYRTLAAFGEGTISGAHSSASLAVRCDRHNTFSTRCGANAALLLRPSESLSLRLSAGHGWFAPTPYTEETETADLRGLVSSRLGPVTIDNAVAELGWRRGPLDLGVTLTADRIDHPVRAVRVPDDTVLYRVTLVNLPEPIRALAATVHGTYRRGFATIRASVTRLQATEFDTTARVPNPAGGGPIEETLRRSLDHAPRGLATLDLGFATRRTGGRINVIARYLGRQFVWDNPYTTGTRGYLVTDLVVSQRTGRARLYLSGENMLNEKIDPADPADEPVILPVPWWGDRRTTMPWKPIRGRVVSLGAVVEW
jgi:iron complex outermembrane receptor protein